MLNIIAFIVTNKEVIALIIGALGLLISLAGVIITRKIFYKGIKLDKTKILNQLSLEFVAQFINPFYEFKSMMNTVLIKENGQVDVNIGLSTLSDILKKKKFMATFSFYEKHIGDVWDCFSEKNQVEAFNSINDFVREAKIFEREVEDLCTLLERCDEGEKSSGRCRRTREKSENKTLKDFLSCETQNDRIIEHGMNQMEKLDICIKKLPAELKIKEMKLKLRRD